MGITGGYYIKATENKPVKEGEFKHIMQGAVPFDDIMVVFSVLSNKEQDDAYSQIIETMERARLVSESVYKNRIKFIDLNSGDFLIGMPDYNWNIHVKLPGFEIIRNAVRQDMSAIIVHVSNESTGVQASFTVTKIPNSKSMNAQQCMEIMWTNDYQNQFITIQMTKSEKFGAPTIEFFFLNGKKNQSNKATDWPSGRNIMFVSKFIFQRFDTKRKTVSYSTK